MDEIWINCGICLFFKRKLAQIKSGKWVSKPLSSIFLIYSSFIFSLQCGKKYTKHIDKITIVHYNSKYNNCGKYTRRTNANSKFA